MKHKLTIPMPERKAQPYVMGIADKLSDDPMLLRLLGPRFKVLVQYDTEKRRVTYSFRAAGDTSPDEADAKRV